MIEKIPAKTILKCDVCLRTVDRFDGTLQFTWSSKDYMGNRWGIDERKIEMCEACLGKMAKAINGVQTEVSNEDQGNHRA